MCHDIAFHKQCNCSFFLESGKGGRPDHTEFRCWPYSCMMFIGTLFWGLPVKAVSGGQGSFSSPS